MPSRWEIGAGGEDKPKLLVGDINKEQINAYIEEKQDFYKNNPNLLTLTYGKTKGEREQVVEGVLDTINELKSRAKSKPGTPFDFNIGYNDSAGLVTLFDCLELYSKYGGPPSYSDVTLVPSGIGSGESGAIETNSYLKVDDASAVFWIAEGVARACIAKKFARESYLKKPNTGDAPAKYYDWNDIRGACWAYLANTLKFVKVTSNTKWNYLWIRSAMEEETGTEGSKNRDFVQELGENSERFRSVSPLHVQEAIKAGFGCVLAKYGIMIDIETNPRRSILCPKPWAGGQQRANSRGAGLRKQRAEVPFERAWRIVEESILSVMTPAGLLLSIHGDSKLSVEDQEVQGGTDFMKDQAKGKFPSYTMQQGSKNVALNLQYSPGYKDQIDGGCFAYFNYLVARYFLNLTGSPQTPECLLSLPMPNYNIMASNPENTAFLLKMETRTACDLARMMADSMNMFIVRDSFSVFRTNARLGSQYEIRDKVIVLQSQPPLRTPCPLINILWVMIKENPENLNRDISSLCKHINTDEGCKWESLYKPPDPDMQLDDATQDNIIELAKAHLPRNPNEDDHSYGVRVDEFVLSLKVLGQPKHDSIMKALSYYQNGLTLFDGNPTGPVTTFEFDVKPFEKDNDNMSRAFVVKTVLDKGDKDDGKEEEEEADKKVPFCFLGIVLLNTENHTEKISTNTLDKKIREANKSLHACIEKFQNFDDEFFYFDIQELTESVTKICLYDNACTRASLTRKQMSDVYAKSSVCFGMMPFLTGWLTDQVRFHDGNMWYRLLYYMGPLRDKALAMYLAIGIVSLGAALTGGFAFKAMMGAISQCLNPASGISLGIGAAWLATNAPAAYDIVANDQSTWRHAAQTLIAKHGSVSAVRQLTLRHIMSVLPARTAKKGRAALGSLVQALAQFRGIQENVVKPKTEKKEAHGIWTSASKCLSSVGTWLMGTCFTVGKALILLAPLVYAVYQRCVADGGTFSQDKFSEEMGKVIESSKAWGIHIFIIMLTTRSPTEPDDEITGETEEKKANKETVESFRKLTPEEKKELYNKVYGMAENEGWQWSDLFKMLDMDFLNPTKFGNEGIFYDVLEKEGHISKAKVFRHVGSLFSSNNLRTSYVYLQYISVCLGLSYLIPAVSSRYLNIVVVSITAWCVGVPAEASGTSDAVLEQSQNQIRADAAVVDIVNKYAEEHLNPEDCTTDTLNWLNAWKIIYKTSDAMHSRTKSILQSIIPIWARQCQHHCNKEGNKLLSLQFKMIGNLPNGHSDDQLKDIDTFRRCYEELGLATPANRNVMVEAASIVCSKWIPMQEAAYETADKIIGSITSATGGGKWSLKCADDETDCVSATFGGMTNTTMRVQNCTRDQAERLVNQLTGGELSGGELSGGTGEKSMLEVAEFINYENRGTDKGLVTIPKGVKVVKENQTWHITADADVDESALEEISATPGWAVTLIDSSLIVLTYYVRCTLQSWENEMHEKAHTSYFSEILAQQKQVKCPNLNSSAAPYVWLNMNLNDDSPFTGWMAHLKEYDKSGESKFATVARGEDFGSKDLEYFSSKGYASQIDGGGFHNGRGIVLNSEGFARIPGATCVES